jgi:hypothetical protein
MIAPWSVYLRYRYLPSFVMGFLPGAGVCGVDGGERNCCCWVVGLGSMAFRISRMGILDYCSGI